MASRETDKRSAYSIGCVSCFVNRFIGPAVQCVAQFLPPQRFTPGERANHGHETNREAVPGRHEKR
jgi:hypothetical protein